MWGVVVIFAFVSVAPVVFCGAQKVADHPICQVQFDQSTSGQGVLKRTFDNSSYCAYLGVRYVEPPVGRLRFRPPVLLHPKGHHNYTTAGSKCPQYRIKTPGSKVVGEEDCLFMNIYSPMMADSSRDVAGTSLFPVLVFVHGGSYVVGWGERDIHGVDLLIENGILVVTFNYRIFALGFLKSPEHNIAGNFGLKDQTMLLRWVQQYIHHFGGDPNQVTFAGQSAGAGSVTHHLYIEQSRNLFHRMIVLSGAFVAPWSFMYDARDCIQTFLDELPGSSLEQLRSMDFREFFQRASWQSYSVHFAGMVIPCFIPVPERAEVHRDNFTVRSPHASIIERPLNQVPVLISDTALEFEGLLSDFDRFYLGENWPSSQNETISNLVNDSVHKFAAQLIAEGRANSTAQVFHTLANTANLHYPTHRLVKDLTRTLDPSLPVYYQMFEFDGMFGEAKYEYYKEIRKRQRYGAIHGDDLGYIFSPHNLADALERPQDFQKEWKVHRATVELVANFVKYGNPTPSPSKLSNIIWPAVNGHNASNLLLNIDETVTLRPIPDDIYSQYWEKVYDCVYYGRCHTLEN